MIRGTRVLLGDQANKFRSITDSMIVICKSLGYMEFIPSALSDVDIFVDKAGTEVLGQMYTFKDKKDRDICLVPEITAIVQRLYKDEWSKFLPKPVKIFYLSRCYRYERPQEGRYREFWQFGVESLGGNVSQDEIVNLLRLCLDASLGKDKYFIKEGIKRGLDYYITEGFEAEVSNLGAQKQVAGGGRYDCGIGFAIGIDRVLLANEKYLKQQ